MLLLRDSERKNGLIYGKISTGSFIKSRHLLNIFLYIAIYYVILHKTEIHSFSSTILPDLIRLLLFKDTTGSEDITFK